jgi:hypothetical protein
MLLGVVHHLLLTGRRDDPLAAFYASLTAEPGPPEAAFPAFRAFCLGNAEAVAGLLRRRVVGTNEVGRAACLLPAFADIAARAPGPLHLVEVGASAGLNLLWDRFAYDYGPAGRLGPRGAPLTLDCQVRGTGLPPLPAALPSVGARIGIDSMPLDPADPEDAAWLCALVWPEQRARAERLTAALALAARLRPQVIAGDGSELLPRVAGTLPRDGTLCVFHSFTLNQFGEVARDRFEAVLRSLARARPLFRLALEWGAGPAPELTLTRYDDRGAERRQLARCEAHGAWLEWLAPDTGDRRA